MTAGRLLTPPDHLHDAACSFRRQAARLEDARADLAGRMSLPAFAGSWEGKVAERFLVHLDAGHRQAHLAEAARRLQELAAACQRAADANAHRIDRNRVLRDRVVDALVAKHDYAAMAKLPTSLRDTRWPSLADTVVAA
ncbi:MAG TPA: hypothetical protein VFJ85_09275 [Acidimicrobiales bacterium]|nr:hypothetical protein [Acidimicrobiales bacterium]